MFPPNSPSSRFPRWLPRSSSNASLVSQAALSRTATEILTEYKPKSVTKQRSQLLEHIETPEYDGPVICECVGRCIDNDCPCFQSRQYCDKECHGCSTTSTEPTSTSASASASRDKGGFWGKENKSVHLSPNEKGMKRLVKKKSANILRKLGIIHPPPTPISPVVEEKNRFKLRPKWGMGLGWRSDGEIWEGRCGNWHE